MRACTFFQTNAATANRMILRMIVFLRGVDGIRVDMLCFTTARTRDSSYGLPTLRKSHLQRDAMSDNAALDCRNGNSTNAASGAGQFL